MSDVHVVKRGHQGSHNEGDACHVRTGTVFFFAANAVAAGAVAAVPCRLSASRGVDGIQGSLLGRDAGGDGGDGD